MTIFKLEGGTLKHKCGAWILRTTDWSAIKLLLGSDARHYIRQAITNGDGQGSCIISGLQMGWQYTELDKNTIYKLSDITLILSAYGKLWCNGMYIQMTTRNIDIYKEATMATILVIDIKNNHDIIPNVQIKDDVLLVSITGCDNQKEFERQLNNNNLFWRILEKGYYGRYTTFAIPVDENTITYQGGEVLTKAVIRHDDFGVIKCEMIYGGIEPMNDHQKSLLNSIYGKASYMNNRYKNVAKIDYTTLHKGANMTNELTALEKGYMVHNKVINDHQKALLNSVYGKATSAAEENGVLTWEHSMNRLLLPKFRSATQPDLSGHIKKVIFSDPVTVIIWDDGSKTRVRAQGDTPYDPMVGMAMCISKYALGNTNKWFDTFKKWLPEEEKEPETRVEFAMAFDDVAKKIREIVENISSDPVTIDRYALKSTTPKDLNGAFHMFVVNPDLESLHIMTDSCLKADGTRYSKHYISRCLSRYRNEYILAGECRFEVLYNKRNDYIVIRNIK